MTLTRIALRPRAFTHLAIMLFASAIAGQTPPDSTPNLAPELQAELEQLAKRAQPGTLGIAILDLQTGSRWGINANHEFPMMSVFKAPVAATVLSRIDSGTLSMEQTITLKRSDIVAGSAVPSIGENFRGEQMTFSLRQLLVAAVSQSDNTAVDALLRVLGGPLTVTEFLYQKGIGKMYVDEDEGSVSKVFAHLHGAPNPPINETPEQKDKRLRRGYRAFLADPRNHSTPNAAVLFLQRLWGQQLLSRSSTQYLLELMYAQTTPHRLRDGLAPGVRLADKCGTSETIAGKTAAYNDIGIMTWPDGHTVLVAAFLTDSRASKTERDALFQDLARETSAAVHGPTP